MYQPHEFFLTQKKRVPEQFHSNTFRIFNEKLPESLGRERYNHSYVFRRNSSLLDHQSSPNIHNIPQPYYAKCITTNVRTFNDPIYYMETENQGNWRQSAPDSKLQLPPPYSRDSTQRSDFTSLPQTHILNTRYGANPNKSPASGIVPTASPNATPKVLLEKMSFIHQYDSRKWENEPIRGRRHGAFVWTEIRPTSGLRPPSGADAFLSTERSRSLPAQQRAEKGSTGEGKMTSLDHVSQYPPQMLDFGTHLLKTDLKEAAKAYPKIPAQDHAKLGVPQAAGMDSVPAKGEGVQADPILTSLEQKCQGRSNSLHSNVSTPKLPSSTAICSPPSANAQVDTLVPTIDNNSRHQLTPVGRQLD